MDVFHAETLVWLAGFAQEASEAEAVDAWLDRIDGKILAEVPEVARDPLLVQDLHASSRSHWMNFLDQLPAGRPTVVVTPEAEQLALSLARGGLEVGVLLKVYRVAQTALWEYITEVIEGLPPGSPGTSELLVPMWTRAATWINVSVERVIEVYSRERERVSQGVMARRVEIVSDLLAGGPVNTGVVSTALDHPLREHQTAFVVRADDHETVGALKGTAQKVARVLGSARPLVVARGSRDVHCWVATTRVPDLRALDGLADELAANGTSVAVGIPTPGVDGFRSSHIQALAVQRLGALAARPLRVQAYADVALLTLLAGDPEWSDAFAARVLGGLAAHDQATTRVRTTVHAVLENARNLDQVAKQLSVHRNTVRYRLGQAEDLLGCRVADHPVDVTLALRWFSLRSDPSSA